MIRIARQFAQNWLRNSGIEVRKVPPAFEALSVFCLAVEGRMAQRGDALRFVQIGANDGVVGDPLRSYILERGWTGILVEPQPAVFAQLKANYSECADRLVFENLAIGPSETVPLYVPIQPVNRASNKAYGTGAASSNAAVTARQLNLAPKDLQRIDIPAITLDKLFEKHGLAELDLLQIDAEGFDWQVLKTLDLKRFRPAIIQLETGHLQRPDLAAMAQALNVADYVIYFGGWQGDTLAMRPDTISGR